MIDLSPAAMNLLTSAVVRLGLRSAQPIRDGLTAGKTASGEQPPRPTGSTRTILAAIGMLYSARVGGRALPRCGNVSGSGGRIGSKGDARDSIGNRRDASGVRPKIGRDASGAD
jgi:hypothetical protein